MPHQKQQSTQYKAFFKKNWVQNILWLLALLAIFLVLRPFMQGDVAQGQAPSFIAKTITGETINLADFKGEPVLIHFWATWCPICELELDGIEEVAKSYKLIKIATNSGTDEELLAYAKENNMVASTIINDSDSKLMQLYGAKAVPASFMLDKNGEIKFIEVGFTTSYGLKTRLWSLK
jgi:thiol-disulfide isomerase/thioredoxin